MNNQQVVDLFVDQNVLQKAQADDVLTEAQLNGKTIVQAMVDGGFMDEAGFYRTMAEGIGAEFIDLNDREIGPEVVKIVPAGLARLHRALPVELVDGTLRVALADPLEPRAAEDLRFALGSDIEVVVAPVEQIEDRIKQFLRQRHLQHGGDAEAAGRSGRADAIAGRRRCDWSRSGSERYADHSLCRSDSVSGDPGPRQRHPFRAIRKRIQNPLSRRRRALRNGAAAAASGTAGHFARESDGEHEHRRAPAAAGWPHPKEYRRPQRRHARLDFADAIRRERRAARARSLHRESRSRGARHARVHPRLHSRSHPAAERHFHCHRPDRLRENDDALFLPAQDQHDRFQSC